MFFTSAKGSIVESLYINGVHWPKQEHIKINYYVYKTHDMKKYVSLFL